MQLPYCRSLFIHGGGTMNELKTVISIKYFRCVAVFSVVSWAAGGGHHPDLDPQQDPGMLGQGGVGQQTGVWLGLQTRPSRAQSGCMSSLFCWQSDSLTRMVLMVKSEDTIFKALVAFRVRLSQTLPPRSESGSLEELHEKKRGYSNLCIWPLSLMSRLVSVSLRVSQSLFICSSFCSPFYFLYAWHFPASVNSISLLLMRKWRTILQKRQDGHFNIFLAHVFICV